MHHLVVDGAPPKLGGYLRSVLLPRRGFKRDTVAPAIRITRRNLRFGKEHLDEFVRLCRWRPSPRMPLMYPLMLLFHYHLGIFAHPAFPCSLRQLLGYRNHVVQRRHIAVDELLDLDVRTIGQRVLPKGVEFDFYSTLASGGKAVWESVHVYYLRGAYGGSDMRVPAAEFEALGNVDFETRWDAPTDGKWKFAKFCGDFNPAHYYAPWARLLGFRRDFSHTQRIVADCLRRLPQKTEVTDSESLRLDVAYKGPVYYGSPLTMKTAVQRDGYRFDLYCGEIEKPAIPGRLRIVAPNHDLLTGST